MSCHRQGMDLGDGEPHIHRSVRARTKRPTNLGPVSDRPATSQSPYSTVSELLVVLDHKYLVLRFLSSRCVGPIEPGADWTHVFAFKSRQIVPTLVPLP